MVVHVQVLHSVSVDMLGGRRTSQCKVWKFILPILASADTTLAGKLKDASLPLPKWPPLTLWNGALVLRDEDEVPELYLTFTDTTLLWEMRHLIRAGWDGKSKLSMWPLLVKMHVGLQLFPAHFARVGQWFSKRFLPYQAVHFLVLWVERENLSWSLLKICPLHFRIAGLSRLQWE